MLETLVVHDQHNQIHAFDSDLQSPTSATNGDERRCAPACIRTGGGHTPSMLATEDEATFDQVWHYEDALCIAQHFLRDALIWSRHDGVQDVTGRFKSRIFIFTSRAGPGTSSNQAYEAHQQH